MYNREAPTRSRLARPREYFGFLIGVNEPDSVDEETERAIP